jgi:hypothetical protein
VTGAGCGLDFHHHAILPGYLAQLDEWAIGAQPGVPFPAWTPEVSLRWMDDVGVERALLSVGSPGFYFGSASISQTERALGAEGFDGVGLLTQYGGRPLGDPGFDEFYQLLDAHGALVHVHPTVPEGWDASAPVRPSLIEYPFETTRTILELARNRVFSRHPNIRWVFSHGGGSFAALADRMSGGDIVAPIAGGDNVQDLLAASRFDSALVGAAGLAALAVAAGKDHIVYGSDLPFVTVERIARDRAALQHIIRGDEPARGPVSW